MKKRKKTVGLLCLLILIPALALAGCGNGGSGSETESGQGAERGVNLLEIKKDGVLSNTTREDFSPEDYGDEEALKEFVLRNASECNALLGEEQISVKKVEVKKDAVTLVMEYQSGEAFATLHDYPFFYGTVAQAYDEGYDLDVELYEAGEGETVSIGKEQLLEMGSRNIIIAQLLPRDHLTIQTSGKILYIRGADYVKSNTAEIYELEDGEERETAYIVFK